MSTGTLRRRAVAFAAFVLLASSCGQYENAHSGAAGQVTSGGTGSLLDGESAGAATSTGSVDSSTGGAGSLPPGAGSNPASGAADSSSTSTTGSAAAPSVPSGPGDTTGVTGTTITIGIHAPLTGAAPVREESFQAGKDLYWNYGNDGKPVEINGRTVKVVFEDDHYNPSYARQVCQKMAEQDHAFLLIGGAGTDQIQACAQYAASMGIPYLSAGVTEVGMDDLSNYFALSMTYPDQAPLVAQEIKHRFHVTDPSRVALVVTDTANFDDTVNAFTRAFPGVTVFRPSKNENGSTMAANLCTGTVKNYDAVFPLVAPVYYLQMAKAADCHPQYVGVGISMGLDTVANIGCPDTVNAQFFSPFPAWADRQRYDPSFEKAVAAARKDNPDFADDDIVWILWNLMKTVAVLFQDAGPDLTRQGFISSTEHASVSSVTAAPHLQFSPGDHFGASSVANLVNVCTESGGYYKTRDSYRSSF